MAAVGGGAIIRTYSTAGVEQAARVAYWNDLSASLFSPLAVVAADPDAFEARLSIAELGPLFIAHVTSQPARIEHTDRHVALTRMRQFVITTPVRGRMLMSHYGREIVLEEGDFALGDSAAPSRLRFDDPYQLIAVVLPETVLRAHIPVPERICGLPMAGSRGMGSIVSDMLSKIWHQVEGGLPREFGAPLARNLLDVVATAYGIEYSAVMAASAVTSTRLAHIKRFVESNLRDPALTPALVAEAFGVSSRYVRMLFARQHENLSAYILRRRLEECAEQLSSVVWRGHTIAETASSWGFTSMAHFTRVFKERFGVTPREYRRQHLPPPSRRGSSSGPRVEGSPGADDRIQAG